LLCSRTERPQQPKLADQSLGNLLTRDFGDAVEVAALAEDAARLFHHRIAA